MGGMALPKRWPDARAEWKEPEDWLTPDLMEVLGRPPAPGDVIELADGRRMRVVLRDRLGALHSIDA